MLSTRGQAAEIARRKIYRNLRRLNERVVYLAEQTTFDVLENYDLDMNKCSIRRAILNDLHNLLLSIL